MAATCIYFICDSQCTIVRQRKTLTEVRRRTLACLALSSPIYCGLVERDRDFVKTVLLGVLRLTLLY